MLGYGIEWKRVLSGLNRKERRVNSTVETVVDLDKNSFLPYSFLLRSI